MLSVSTWVECVISIVSVGRTVVDGIILAETVAEELDSVLLVNILYELVMLSVGIEVKSVVEVVSMVIVVDGIILTEVIDEEIEAVLVNKLSELIISSVDGNEVDSCNILEGTLVVMGIVAELNSMLLVSGDCDVDIEVVVGSIDCVELVGNIVISVFCENVVKTV